MIAKPWLYHLILFCHVLNMLDCAVSLHLFNIYPHLTEANIILQKALNISPGFFVFTKLSLGHAGIHCLGKQATEDTDLAPIALILLLIVTALLSTVVMASISAIFWLPDIPI